MILHMIFVNTSLEVALKRNQMRARKLPDAIVMTKSQTSTTKYR